MKHKYYDAIVAWANGEEIEYKDTRENTGWKSWDLFIAPLFNDSEFEWRVKPKTIVKKYRMALFTDGKVHAIDVKPNPSFEKYIAGFVRWIGDAVEYEVEE